MVRQMETQHGMLASMATPRARGLATAADLEDDRQEVVRGELVRKASPSFEHGEVQGTIFGRLLGFRGHGNPGGWWMATEVEIELAPHEVYLPDIAGWRIEHVPERPRGRPVRMAPNWVCEILSPSTASRDLGHKLQTYHLARVGHYWVVEPFNQTITVYGWHEAGYVVIRIAGARELARLEPFDAVALDLGDIFEGPQQRE